MKILRVLLVTLCVVAAAQAVALIETYEFSNPELEVRYQQLSEELRCPKCQNQNIADSNAPIAQDLRGLLHEQLEQGASDDEILEYMVDRYGEFVRYRPRFGGTTLVLWMAPVLLLLAGGVVLLLTLRSRPQRTDPASSALSSEEQARVQALLDKSEQDS